jgi:hypothetical protein
VVRLFFSVSKGNIAKVSQNCFTKRKAPNLEKLGAIQKLVDCFQYLSTDKTIIKIK